ncbi:elongation factor P maturation arginine rhamnosyltransferase EarP [Xylophilus sp.]|uniref:elongation factor P maturation arginine rhamnosyltransferase EarP n=1 Tax=Xylophilus sp. TaxID=2653893 RepID=UPI0013B92205|nr:elongation factor P maturation arginine rhamnosyltransferase EarP [Xylophilus sp.]KAF1044792.1 MAG: hypothetical protein GAK38_03392 [Xylophilus sp.]
MTAVDIFCRVIDNYGDIGVCWRLAADLAARGRAVRLWTDDAFALAWMAPRGAPGVAVLPWPADDAPPPAGGPGELVIEAFGCELPAGFAAGITDTSRWINLEYLSAEPYVERCHGLPSPVFSGPAAGCTKHFFYPGFTPRTGGLLREPGLVARQAAFDAAAWRAARGLPAPGGDALVASLFCYEPAALAPLLAQWDAGAQPVHLLVAPGRAAAAVAALPAPEGRLTLHARPAVPQPAFDEMLWACDLNFVRGEDSLVRALWAGRPFVWHIYPQDDAAHHAKLDAFLGWLQAPPALRALHHAWNGVVPAAGVAAPGRSDLAGWRGTAGAARARALAQDDLATQLLSFRPAAKTQ